MAEKIEKYNVRIAVDIARLNGERFNSAEINYTMPHEAMRKIQGEITELVQRLDALGGK